MLKSKPENVEYFYISSTDYFVIKTLIRMPLDLRLAAPVQRLSNKSLRYMVNFVHCACCISECYPSDWGKQKCKNNRWYNLGTSEMELERRAQHKAKKGFTQHIRYTLSQLEYIHRWTNHYHSPQHCGPITIWLTSHTEYYSAYQIRGNFATPPTEYQVTPRYHS
jgi:hypothetical protein